MCFDVLSSVVKRLYYNAFAIQVKVADDTISSLVQEPAGYHEPKTATDFIFLIVYFRNARK